MTSAFGIDHGGEISKGRLPYKLVKVPKHKISSEIGPSRPKRIKDALNRAGEAPISIKGVGRAAGRGISQAGGFIQQNPGKTGAALVGGGAGAGYYHLSNKEPKKKS